MSFFFCFFSCFCFQAEDGIRDLVRSRGLGDVYKRQVYAFCRYIDDLIDKAVGDSNGEINNELVIKTVKRWQSNLDSVYAGDSLSLIHISEPTRPY